MYLLGSVEVCSISGTFGIYSFHYLLVLAFLLLFTSVGSFIVKLNSSRKTVKPRYHMYGKPKNESLK